MPHFYTILPLKITSTELMAPGFKVLSSGVSNGSNASPANTESLAEAHNIKASIKEVFMS